MVFTVTKTNSRLSKDILCKFDEQSIQTLLNETSEMVFDGILLERPNWPLVIGQLPEHWTHFDWLELAIGLPVIIENI
jgi:hypothetical protein